MLPNGWSFKKRGYEKSDWRSSKTNSRCENQYFWGY